MRSPYGDVIAGPVMQDKQLVADAIKGGRSKAGDRGILAKRPCPDSDSEAEAARLVTRASVLLEQGDIGSARIALQRAVGSISGGHFLARRTGDCAGRSPLHAIAVGDREADN